MSGNVTEADPSLSARQVQPLCVGVIGAGIVGLAHAWSAAKRGYQVTVLERGASATEASFRNFGMIWPIGQPAGELREIAMASRQAWLELANAAGICVHPCGSLHLAHRTDEWEVLQEFAAHPTIQEYGCELLSPQLVLKRSPAVNPSGLLGGLFSPTELCVNPRCALGDIARYLTSRFNVNFNFQTAVTEVQGNSVRSADGRRWTFDRLVICGGAEFAILFPELLKKSGLVRCKLQMMKTAFQPDNWRIGPHLAGGLTLRHYANFAMCASLAAVKRRIAEETPELDRFGIHVMASQNDQGEVILGDSHEYDAAIEPFDKTRIDELMLRELRRIICLRDWTISERWHGVYAKHPSQPLFEIEPLPGVHICTGTGGSGMTMSFGLGEKCWNLWEGSP